MVEMLAHGVPLTNERAVTELIQCRRHLVTARESLEVALEILERLNGEAGSTPTAALREVLGELEEAEAVIRSAPIAARRHHA